MKTDHHISQLELINNVNSIFAKTNKGVDLKYSKILPDKIIIDSGFKDVPVKLISTDLLRVVLSNLIRLKVGSYFSVNDRYLKTKKRKPHQRRRYTKVRFSFTKKSKKKKKNAKNSGFLNDLEPLSEHLNGLIGKVVNVVSSIIVVALNELM